MKGILLISHGEMAKGTVDTCRFIMGESLSQIDFCCLENGESPEHYGEKLKDKVNTVNTGEGVIIFCDLYGGTPCKEAIMRLDDKTELIAGMNFPVILEAITKRITGDIDTDELISVGGTSIIDVKKAISEISFSEEYE